MSCELLEAADSELTEGSSKVTNTAFTFEALTYLNVAEKISGLHGVALLLVPLDNGSLAHGWGQAGHVD